MLILTQNYHENIVLTIPPSTATRTVVLSKIPNKPKKIGIEAPKEIEVTRLPIVNLSDPITKNYDQQEAT